MKIRTGFVSNSSASSFVVIDCDFNTQKYLIYDIDFKCGTYEFGWEEEKYYDLRSKINWAVLMACKNKRYLKMIQDMLWKEIGFNLTNIEIEEIQKEGYIDHQAINDENIKAIFKKKYQLKCFLFSSKSYIQTGNDNV